MVGESDEKHDRLFNYLSARVSSRESASLSLVGIASSASLVLLGLVFEKITTAYWEFFSIGIVFPSLAFAYNEITNRGLHKDDQKVINDLIKNIDEQKWEKETKDIVINKKYRLLRLGLMRFCLLSPALGWLLTLPIYFQLDPTPKIITDILIVADVILISFLISYSNKIK